MTKPADLRRDDETLDAFYHGRVRVLQKKRGYRFSVDAPLLADFIRTKPEDEALDIGTGSGVISLLLCAKPVRRAEDIRRSLFEQLSKPVLWESSMRRMIADGARLFYEVGPGKVLSGLLKRIERSVDIIAVGTVDDLAQMA